MLEGLRRSVGERGGQIKQPKIGITLAQLEGMLEGLSVKAQAAAPGSIAQLKCLRDKAVLVLGFFGWLRGGELSGAEVSRLKSSARSYDLSIPKAKTDQHSKGHLQVVPKRPKSGVPVGEIIAAYLGGLRAHGLAAPQAPLFPHFAWGKVTPGKRMTGAAVSAVVRDGIDYINGRLAAAGRTKRLDRNRRAGHSLRRGGLNHGFDCGLSREARQVLGRWRAEASQDDYVEWCHKHRLACAETM